MTDSGKASSLLAEGYRYETTDGRVSEYSSDGNGVVGATTVKVRPQGEFAYIDANGNEAVQTGCKELTSEALYDDKENVVGKTVWYAASGDVTISGGLCVYGTLNLILCDGATVNAPLGLYLGLSNAGPGTLNVYAQSAGTGRLTVTHSGQTAMCTAGIRSNYDGSSLNIYGGTVQATGSSSAVVPGEPEYSGAGIGTCANDTDGKILNVNIYGGTLIAKSGGKGAAAIGSGQAADGTVNVTIAKGMKCVKTDDLTVKVSYDNTEGDSVTITKCSDHQWEYTQSETNHTSRCELCGTDGTTEEHSYTGWTSVDAATHTGTCVCGATRTENHSLSAATANADGLTHSSKCSVCGYEAAEEEHSFDGTSGKCSTCGAVWVTTINNRNYASLTAAIAAANGADIELLRAFGENVVVADGTTASIILGADSDGTSYWMGGYYNIYYIGVPLTVEGGSITLKGGTLEQSTNRTQNKEAITLKGGALTVMDSVIIGGEGPTSRQPAIEATGGTLDLQGNTELVGGLSLSGGAKLANGLKGGIFINMYNDNDRISVAGSSQYSSVFDLLAEGYVFAEYDAATDSAGAVIDKAASQTTLTVDVTVIPCTHDFENGICKVCGFQCTEHTLVSGNCGICGQTIVAKDDATPCRYYVSLSEALGSVADGGTITLLTDVKENVTVEAGRTVTFDVNGHTWENYDTGSNAQTVTAFGNVTVTGSGVMQNSRAGNDICVRQGGQSHLEAGMTFSRVWAYENASVTLDAGVVITKNIFSREGNLFGYFTGKALQRYDSKKKAPVEDSYVPLSKYYDGGTDGLTGCVIVIEHTKHVFEKGTTGYCDICGAACDHASMKDTDPVCPDCHAEYVASVVITDVNGDTYPERFTVLDEALVYANCPIIGGKNVKKAELTLFKDATRNGEFSFDYLTERMEVDINLNGKTLTWTSSSLNINGGKVSIHDGSIRCTDAESRSAIHVEEKNQYKPELTLNNVNISTTSGKYNSTSSVWVYSGKLTIQGEGQYSVLEVGASGAVQLSGGSFEGIEKSFSTTEGDVFTPMLAEGYIYVDENGNFLSEEALKQQASANQSVKGYCTDAVRVVKCENHSFEASKCTKCGYECLHKDGEESTLDEYGVCTVCDYVCPHPADKVTAAGEVYTCSDCEAQMVLKVEYTDENGDQQKYYAQTFDSWHTENTLQTILKDDTITPDSSKITLLANDLCAFAFVDDGKAVTLDLNGKNLVETFIGGFYVDENSTLTVTGEGSSTSAGDTYSYVFNVRGGTLEFDDGFGGTFNGIRVGGGTLISSREEQDNIHIGTLQIDDAGAKVSVKAAAFDKIAFDGTSGSVKLGDLLGGWKDAEGNTVRSGNAFRYTMGDQAFVPYNTVIDKDNPIENIKTAVCPHDSVMGRTCAYCGTEHLVAMIIERGGASDMTYAAADDSEEETKTVLGNALNTWNKDGDQGTLKPLVDVTLTADAPLDADENPKTGAKIKTIRGLDLNGHNFTNADGTAYGVVVNELVTLTVRDSSADKGSFSAGMTVNDGATLIVDGIHMGTITAAASTAEITLKAGSSFEGYSLPAGMILADWIEDGCCIYDTGADGKSKIPVALTETGTKTAAGKFVVEKAAVKVTAGKVTGEITYGSIVSDEFYPEVTLTDAAAYENFGFIRVEWYCRTDSGCQRIGSGTFENGSYVFGILTPEFAGIKVGDVLKVFCTITAVDNTGAETPFWQTVITGYELTVVRANSYVITEPAATKNMVYKAAGTDKKWSLVTAGTAEGGTVVYSLSEDGVYEDAIPTAEDAGSYTVWYKVRGDENHTDTKPVKVDVEIAKAELAIDGFTLAEKVYDGTTDAVVTGISFQNSSGQSIGSELVSGTDYTVTAAFEDANAGRSVKAKATVTLLDTERTQNYELTGNEAEGDFQIKKAPAPAASAATLYILNNRTAKYTFDLIDLLPELDAGCDFGGVTINRNADVTWNNSAYSTADIEVRGNLLNIEVTSTSSVEEDAGKVEVNVLTDNYEDIMLTLTVKSTNKKIVELKDGSTVSVSGKLTYGQKLSELTLQDAVFVERGTDTEITGTLKWSSPDTVPDAGTTRADWIFTPDESELYKEVTGWTTITVEKADPVVTELPVVTERVYDPNMALADSDLTGGAVSVAGSWSFSGTGIIPTVDNTGYEAVFMPDDTTNYNAVTKTITVKVTKATPYIAENPSASAITYGKTLADSILTGGKAAYKDENGAEIAGSFAWKQRDLKPAVSDSSVTEYEVTFIPADTVNYNTVDTKMLLSVNKAAYAPNMPGDTMQPAHSTIRISDITLPDGWSWADADRDKELADKVPVTAKAVYTAADKDNYDTVSVSVTITRSECEHRNTEIRNQKDASCTQAGYAGDTYCADCGAFLTSGKETTALGHDYKSAVTKEPTTTEEGVRTYTCSRCHAGYTESIAKLSGGSSGSQGSSTAGSQGSGTGSQESSTGSQGSGTGSQGSSTGSQESSTGSQGSSTGSHTNTGGEVKLYIKDENGKEGWEAIRLQLEDSEAGEIVTVVMNGTTVVPKNIFDSIRGEDVTLTLDMGDGITWMINGKEIAEVSGDIDLGVTMGTQAGKSIPVDVINSVSGERYSTKLTLSYDGEFGFTARLIVNLDSENAGLYANLFYYNERTGKPEFISAGEIGEDGSAELLFTHASDYLIVIGAEMMDGNGENGTDNTESTEAGNQPAPEFTDETDGQSAWNTMVIIIAGICILLIVIGAVWYVRKKGSEKK